MPEGRRITKGLDRLAAGEDRSGQDVQSQEAAGSCRVKCLNGEKVARRLEGDAVVGSRSETWQRARAVCCSKKESRVSLVVGLQGLIIPNWPPNLHPSVSCSGESLLECW